MADEIRFKFDLNYIAGTGAASETYKRNGKFISKTQVAVTRVAGKMSIATTSTALTKGGVTGNVGFVWGRNLDPTNYIQFSEDGTNWFGKILPGEEFAFPTDAANVYLKANTAACLVAYELYGK